MVVVFGSLYKEISTKQLISSSDEAIMIVQEIYPELRTYPSDNLPIKRIVSESSPKGWLVGFNKEGSGLPGILKAQCYFISKYGEISLTGEFAAKGMGGPVGLDLATCSPKYELHLSYFSDLIMKKIKFVNTNYAEMGLDGKADGFTLMKTFPKLLPEDFNNVQAVGGGYSVVNGKLTYTGNAASNSPGIVLEGLRTLLSNITARLNLKITTTEDIDILLQTLSE